jgi:hypothetical protein
MTAITAAQAVRAYSQRTFTSNGARAIPTTPCAMTASIKTAATSKQVREPRRELNADELAVVTAGTLKPYPAPPIPIPYPNALL